MKGDSLLIVKQISEVLACRSERLFKWSQQVRDFLKRIGETWIIHIPRELNKEEVALANGHLEDIVVVGMKFQCPKLQGAEYFSQVNALSTKVNFKEGELFLNKESTL